MGRAGVRAAAARLADGTVVRWVRGELSAAPRREVRFQRRA